MHQEDEEDAQELNDYFAYEGDQDVDLGWSPDLLLDEVYREPDDCLDGLEDIALPDYFSRRRHEPNYFYDLDY